MWQGVSSGGEERAREIFYFLFSFSSLPSQIYGNWTQVFVGAEGKVDIHDESNAWTPKS